MKMSFSIEGNDYEIDLLPEEQAQVCDIAKHALMRGIGSKQLPDFMTAYFSLMMLTAVNMGFSLFTQPPQTMSIEPVMQLLAG